MAYRPNLPFCAHMYLYVGRSLPNNNPKSNSRCELYPGGVPCTVSYVNNKE